MKQKYIIGDLVKYKVGGLEFIAEITNTSKYGYCFKGVSDDISGTLCKEFAKDIPLTPEILQKNGWKSINGKYALKIKNANYVVLEFTEDGIYTYINENTMLFTIKYIHELQHLLYALHIDSNLKI